MNHLQLDEKMESSKFGDRKYYIDIIFAIDITITKSMKHQLETVKRYTVNHEYWPIF